MWKEKKTDNCIEKMYLLCLETSGINCSVVVSNGETILSEVTENQGRFTHAESLHLFIERAISEANISLPQLDAIAVSGGPGSYTGLRIGVASAKGLCLALSKPLVSVSTLQVLASQIMDNATIIPMLDARRMEVYSAVFDEKHALISPVEAKILDENSYSQWLTAGKVVFLGDGAEKFSKICSHPNAVFIKNVYPQARDMVKWAFKSFSGEKTENVAYYEPMYLK